MSIIYPMQETRSLCMPCPDPINTSCASARLIFENQQNIWAFMIGLILGMFLVFLIFAVTKQLSKKGFRIKFKIEDDPPQSQSPVEKSGEDIPQ